MDMKKISKILISAAVAAMMLVGCAQPAAPSSPSSQAAPANALERIKQAGKLVVSTSPDYAPFEFEDLRKSGQESYVGADMELAKYIAEKLGVDLVIEPIEFAAVVAAVNEGKADLAISGLSVNPERAEQAALSEVYYAGEQQGIVTLKENADSFKTIADLKGKRVAAQNGSIQLDIANAQLTDSTIEMITTLNDGIMLLKSGKVDAVAVDITTGDQFVKNYPELAVAPLIFEYDSEGFVVACKKGETQLMDAVNEIIAEVVSSGKYAQWLTDAVALSEELSK